MDNSKGDYAIIIEVYLLAQFGEKKGRFIILNENSLSKLDQTDHTSCPPFLLIIKKVVMTFGGRCVHKTNPSHTPEKRE